MLNNNACCSLLPRQTVMVYSSLKILTIQTSTNRIGTMQTEISEYFRLQILIFVCITDNSVLNHKIEQHPYSQFHAML